MAEAPAGDIPGNSALEIEAQRRLALKIAERQRKKAPAPSDVETADADLVEQPEPSFSTTPVAFEESGGQGQAGPDAETVGQDRPPVPEPAIPSISARVTEAAHEVRRAIQAKENANASTTSTREWIGLTKSLSKAQEKLRQAKDDEATEKSRHRAERSNLFVHDDDDDDDEPEISVYSGSEHGSNDKSEHVEKPKSRKRKATDEVQTKTRNKSPKIFMPPKPKKPKKSKNVAVTSMLNVASLRGNNIVEDAAQTSHLPAQPTFQIYGNQNKRKQAMANILASMGEDGADREPSAVRTDQHFLDEAIKKFNNHGQNVKPVNGGKWLIRGMKTPLLNYQVLGAGFMVERENSTVRPLGGISGDQMGLGKTLMTLACIMNNPNLEARKRINKSGFSGSTLIVAAPAILEQWKAEIEKHCDQREVTEQVEGGEPIGTKKKYGIKRFMQYEAKMLRTWRIETLKKEFAKNDIVLCTYAAVAKSFPKSTPPADLITARQKSKWYTQHFAEHKGILHDILWYRVVLDECHHIKNYRSHTSNACRALTTKFSWALSGTPIHNTLTEFYPYFKFLGAPCAGSMRTFMANFCSPDDPDGSKKLVAYLKMFMVRRTRADRMFGSRLVDLPKASERTLTTTFNRVERSIYNIVKRRLILKINAGGMCKKNLSAVWTMILRLRQMCAHTLAIQGAISELLEREDFEALKELAKGDIDHQCREYLVHFNNILLGRAAEQEQLQPGADLEHYGDAECLGQEHGQTYELSKYLSFLKQGTRFEEMEERAICSYCSKRPNNPWVTSCRHIYCYACLNAMGELAGTRGQDVTYCNECNQPYTGADAVDDSSLPGETGHKKDNGEDADWIDDLKGPILPSSKTIAVKLQILKWLREEPSCKIIVFTQFLPLIKILKRVCEMEGWQARRYTGIQSKTARQTSLEEFKTKADIPILLASLKAGGQGLNIVEANKVIIMEPWWNESVEQQALARVFRIGQTKPMEFVRLIVGNSIEERMQNLKRIKQREIDGVMEDKHDFREPGAKCDLDELMELFGETRVDDQGRKFIVPEPTEEADGTTFPEDLRMNKDHLKAPRRVPQEDDLDDEMGLDDEP